MSTPPTATDPQIKKARTKRADSDAVHEESPTMQKKKLEEKPIVVEVICLPSMTLTIPRGHYKSKLEDAGRVNYLRYMKSDAEYEIKARIVDLFPARMPH